MIRPHLKHHSSFKIAFPIASVWFGALVGPSMISGVFSTTYFAPYGAVGILLIFLSMGISSLVVGMGSHIARCHQTYDYSSFSKAIYGKLSKYLSPLLEIYMILAMIVGGSAVIAMGSTFITELFGAPAIVGACVMAVISTLLVLWGAKLVRASSSIMSIVMIVGMLILTIFAVSYRPEQLATALSNWTMPSGAAIGVGIIGAIQLGFSNSTNALTLTAVEQTITCKRDSISLGFWSFILNSGAFIVSTLLVLPYCPNVLLEQVPVLTIIKNYLVANAPWLPTVYMLTMFLALLSSGAPQLHAVASRVKKIYPDKGVFKDNDIARNIVTGILYFALCIAISFLGLRTIVSRGYGLLGNLALFLIALPICVVMPIRNKNKNRAHDLQEKCESRNEQKHH